MNLMIVIASVLVVCSLVTGQGFPTAKCPPGEHSVLFCPQKAEPSCTNDTVHELPGPAACGIPQCFCDTPTLRDEDTGKCVKRTDCSKDGTSTKSTRSSSSSKSSSSSSSTSSSSSSSSIA